MTNKNRYADITGIVLIVIIALGFIYMLVKTSPRQSQIDEIAKPVERVNTNILSSEQTTEITKRQKNGDIPITIMDQLPKDNPFIKLEQ